MKKILSIDVPIIILVAFTSCKSAKSVNIWMIGDSTMAIKKKSRHPESGWGVGMTDYTKKNVKIHNHAASGRSTLSYINQGRWRTVRDSLKEGDHVIIQFGHNDEKKDRPKLYTEPFGAFQKNLNKFIDETREKGATPIVCSSIVRRQFDSNGNLIDTHGDYITAAEDIARKTNTPYMDMEKATRKLVAKMGSEQSKTIYNFTKRRQDSTHLNSHGASVVSELFVKEVKLQKLPLSKFLRLPQSESN